MHRNVFGALAILFVVSGLVLLKFSGYVIFGGGDQGGGVLLGSVLWRVGIALGALWLAMPARSDQIHWGRVLSRTGLILLGLFLVSRMKAAILVRLLPVAVGIGLLIYLLRPRSRGRPRQR